ncbi:MAG: DUF928 domain-containing protein [Chlorogloeopsis fritschii C42_A2020_084]|uniref:DUF928 domain-containing protein n=1 Tax=Chlorogloeopsis fritschii TaxID=1124 RepID=UPI001A0BA284|nr:DUF928 domain-containing protein [Chlorogloeopsis fritschii]MBF2009690.1 DUF928 domain-containing protein [Chlorogloeopsis fritschii C42_A2020_084]
MKSYWQNIQLIAALGIVFFGNITYSPQLWAQSVTSRSASLKFTPPPPPPDRGAAGDRGGAASRGCGIGNQSLMALVPKYEQTLSREKTEEISITKVWGLTTAEYPTFWFFVPYQNSSIAAMEFVLKDESTQPSQTVYRTPLIIPEIPGIVSVRLPATTAPLQIGKMYHWFFKVRVKCNPQQPTKLEYVEGWVQPTNLNSAAIARLKQVTPQERIALYVENGIWYDALTALAELRIGNPKNTVLAADWTSLLKSVGLEHLAAQPLINCCSPK